MAEEETEEMRNEVTPLTGQLVSDEVWDLTPPPAPHTPTSGWV